MNEMNEKKAKKYGSKELMGKILQDEKKRREEVIKLRVEINDILNEEDDICDTDRIDEIIAELDIIDPIIGDNEKSFTPVVIRSPKKKRRFIPLKISAACVALLFSVQVISVAAFGVNFFGLSKDMFMALIGAEERQGDISHMASHSREYKTVEEFEKSENIKIVVPTWLPGGIGIESISYLYEYEETLIDIFYTDNINSLSIRLNTPLPDTKGAEVHENDGIIYYLFEEANTIIWAHNGNFYNLTCGFAIDEHAERIIENIK